MGTTIDNFFNRVKEIYDAKLPFVISRKPNENLVTAFAQNSNKLYELNSFTDVGFVFAPFYDGGKKVLFPILESTTFNIEINDLNLLRIDSGSSLIDPNFTSEKSEKEHIKLVQKGIESIQKKEAIKIVLSRKELIKCENFDVINAFKKMLKNYPNAFVYFWFHPKVGLWMGASPERFINIQNNKFKTMALAGTQIYDGSTNVSWKSKEKQEQQFVTDFILEQVKDKINNIEINGPYTVKAGSLVHLRTDISGELKNSNLLESLVGALHPTPAVCGLPKTIAANFILENEGYDRSYYSGYLGELNIDGSTNLFVNLRCLQFRDEIASIYIGGGITLESDSKSEWNETVSKAKVMKTIL